MRNLYSTISLFSIALLAAFTVVKPATATLMLTATGIADGFTLSTFVSGYNFGANYGPISQAILPGGNVITGSVGNHNVYVFNDSDGQTLGSALSATPYICQTGNCNFAMVTAGGQAYGAQAFGGTYEHFASNGTYTPITGPIASVTSYLGMWANPVNGHIISASNIGLIDIDPTTGSYRVINAGVFPDGVSVSADGTIAYVEVGGNIDAYNIATGALLHVYSGNGHAPDGTGVISGGLFDGFIIANNNDGTVGLIDPILGTEAIIASGGSRGDWVAPDTNNGTLFLSQYELVARLSCGPGCSIGVTPPPSTPEPGTIGLFAVGLASLAFARRPKRA